MNASIVQRFQNYLEQHSLSLATIRNYLADLRAFVRWQALWGHSETRLNAADFSNYRDYLTAETGRSPATVNRRLQALRLFGRFLQEMGHVKENPARDLALVRNGSGNGHAPRTLTDEEIERLRDCIRAGRPSLIQRDYAIMQIMLRAGLRVHEVAELEMRAVIQTPRGMSVAILANGNGARVVPLDTSAARALRDYLAVRPAIPNVAQVFVSQRGKPLSMRSVQRAIDTYARAAGLTEVCAQTLRHTCAKNLLRKRNVQSVAKILGHQNLKALEKFQNKPGDW